MRPMIIPTYASGLCVFANRDWATRTNSVTISGTTMSADTLPDWERLLQAAAHLQEILPDATLVGGTAAAIYAGHRISLDADHVVPDLRQRFDEVLGQLESVAGWKTARIRRPVLILGSLDGIETGVRQLIRDLPLEIQEVEVGGLKLTLPTLPEMLRIKAVLILKRNATRDYLDLAAMAENLGPQGIVKALAGFDRYYPQTASQSALQQLIVQLANPMPYDLEQVDLAEYRRLAPKWQDWSEVKRVCDSVAAALL